LEKGRMFCPTCEANGIKSQLQEIANGVMLVCHREGCKSTPFLKSEVVGKEILAKHKFENAVRAFAVYALLVPDPEKKESKLEAVA
jgi:hypothetical protein